MLIKKIKDNLFSIIICGVIFFLGVFAANINALRFFVIDEKIDIVAVASIFTTILIAWYVGTILEKRNQGSKTQKELILKRTEDIFKVIEEFIVKVNSGTILVQEAVSVFKRINVAIDRINAALKYAKLPSDATLNDQIVTDSRALRDLLTNTPIANTPSNTSLQVINGIINISPNRIVEVESKCDSLKQNVLLFQLYINKC